MSPMAFVRRPVRWIQVLSDESRNGHIVSPAPNFAFELVAQRGLPEGDDVDLSNVVLINGSEPVSLDSITQVHRGVPAVRPVQDRRPAVLRNGGGDAVRVVDHGRTPSRPRSTSTVSELGVGGRCSVEPDAPERPCAGVVRPGRGEPVGGDRRPRHRAELPDEHVGEIWLHGDNIGRGYWARPEETEYTFGNKLQSRLDPAATPRAPKTTRCGCAPATSALHRRRAVHHRPDQGHGHRRRPQPLSAGHRGDRRRSVRRDPARLRRGVLGSGARAARRLARPTPARSWSSSPNAGRERAGRTRSPSSTPSARRCHASTPSTSTTFDFVAAGVIPRTTSGKLARRACRAEYIDRDAEHAVGAQRARQS